MYRSEILYVTRTAKNFRHIFTLKYFNVYGETSENYLLIIKNAVYKYHQYKLQLHYICQVKAVSLTLQSLAWKQ
jgi:hypothetical protein